MKHDRDQSSNYQQSRRKVDACHKAINRIVTQSDNTIDQENPELVISVGGDGTLLSAFHLFSHRLAEVRFLKFIQDILGFIPTGETMNWKNWSIRCAMIVKRV